MSLLACRIATVLFAGLLAALPLPALAQGHESHHPGAASAEPSEAATTSPPAQEMEQKGAGGMMGGKGGMGAGGMMGGEGMMSGGGEARKGMGMGEMMDAMRRPKSTELFPSLLELPPTADRQRADLQRRATARMSEGAAVLSEELRALSAAAHDDDLKAMEQAARGVHEGLAQLESAIAVRRALSEEGTGRQTALRWFQSELGLLPSHSAPSARRVLGMAPFELFICGLLIIAVFAGLWLYALRMRRASQLLERLVAGASTDPPEGSGTGTGPVSSVPNSTPPAPSDAELPRLGLLPVERKKLCRLRVARIFQETPDIKTFRLVSCDRGPIPFSYLPGQFLTLTLPVGEKPIRRSYTISSAPTQGYYCEITVKREEQGQGSRFLHDELEEGQTLQVRGPSGKLTFTGDEADSIALISGGVGITPMMSVARALTDMGWRGEVYFIVACRDPEHFIFASELERMARDNPKLHVHAAMSRLEDDLPGYHRGRLTKETLAEWIPDIASQRIHLCGAPAMMDATKAMLVELGVPGERIHTESFGSEHKPDRAPREAEPVPVADALQLSFQSSQKSTHFLPGETVLEAAERVRVDINYSCRVGSCGECAVRLLSGAVKMEVEDALEPEDKAAGVILACQARATSDIAVEA